MNFTSSNMTPNQTTLKLRVKKKRWVANLIMALLWVLLATAKIVYGDFDNWSDYAITILGVFFILQYTYRILTPYITIKNGRITTGNIFTPSLALDAITEVKEFEGDITLQTPDKKLTIDTDVLDDTGVIKLRSLIKSHNPEQNLP